MYISTKNIKKYHAHLSPLSPSAVHHSIYLSLYFIPIWEQISERSWFLKFTFLWIFVIFSIILYVTGYLHSSMKFLFKSLRVCLWVILCSSFHKNYYYSEHINLSIFPRSIMSLHVVDIFPQLNVMCNTSCLLL